MSGPIDTFHTTRALRRVMRDMNLPPGKLAALVDRRLRRVLVSAYLHVPYYRDLMREAGYDPVRHYCGMKDLARIPLSTKQMLKATRLSDLVREDADLTRAHKAITSGSTGIPVPIYRNPYERAIQIAQWLRVLFANGYSARDRVMSLTAPSRIGDGRSFVQHLGVFRRLAVSWGDTAPEEMTEILLRYRPDILYGNRSHLELLALDMGQRDLSYHGLKLLVVTGEVVHDSHRRLFRERFGLEPTESYGSIELGVMAFETPERDGLHPCADLICFEFLDEAGRPVPPGTAGRVVVTDLSKTLMPLIRYDHGDLAIHVQREIEGAGAAFRLTRVLGRDSDFAALPDGRKLLSHDFDRVLLAFPAIGQYRVVQRSLQAFQVLVSTDAATFASIQKELVCRLRDGFPPGLTFDVRRVDQIEPDASGKMRILVSEVAR